MRRSRRKFSAKFKSTVVLEVLMEQKTISEPAQQFEVHPNEISIWKREFLGIHRSGVSYTPKGESAENLELMRVIDEYFIHDPTLGVLGMQDELKGKDLNCDVKRIRRLLRLGHAN